MAQAKSRDGGSTSSTTDADTLDEIRKAVRADRHKFAHVPVANLKLKRSATRLRTL